jgi:hypothetical protein
MITPAGFFSSDINNQDASSKLPHFPRDFIGTVKVVACKGITQREGGHRAFIAELEIESSNIPDTVRVGGKYSWFQSLKEPGTAYPACIAFLYAALGLDSVRDKVKIDTQIKPVQDKYLNMAINDNPALYDGKVNILAGQRLNLQTSNIVTKKEKKDFTIHNFSPASPLATTAAA